MEKLIMCRICLVENVRMHEVADMHLQETFEKLTNISFITEDRRPMLACYFCYARLKQCSYFMMKCLEAEEMFALMLDEDYEQKPMVDQETEYFGGFIKTAIETINIMDVEPQVDTVKEEHSIAYDTNDAFDLMEADDSDTCDGSEVTKKHSLNILKEILEDSTPNQQKEYGQENSTATDKSKNSTPQELHNEAHNATDSLLPRKSKEKYKVAYENFIQWKNYKNANSFSENVLLAYFHELSTKYKPSSLWCIYSMLRSTIGTKDFIDIKTYSKLLAFIKHLSDGYKDRKPTCKVLSSNDVEKFLKEAPDNQYLATKVALIFGITGACRREELQNITTNDVENRGKRLLVRIRNKNKMPRSFIIGGPFYEIVKKYQSVRAANATNNRFFQNYQKGKCTRQPIGVNKFGAMPKEIAKFLGLPDAEAYTGHSFRRTSAKLLADSGAELTLKRHRVWQSTAVAHSYIDEPIRNKTKEDPIETNSKTEKNVEDSVENKTVKDVVEEKESSKITIEIELEPHYDKLRSDGVK